MNQKNILVVDDEIMITTTLATLIKMMTGYKVFTYNDSKEALEALNTQKVDLVISDFMMPHMNGLEFLRKVRELDKDAVLIMLTGYADKENAIKSINEVGLYYYLEKPWDNTALIRIIQNGLEKRSLTDALNKKVSELQELNEEIKRLYDLLKRDYQNEMYNIDSLMISLANVIEAKDHYTDGHTRRVGKISSLIGNRMGLDAEEVENLKISGIIHDIGKVGVPEAILNKPGKLTVEEFDIIKKHTIIGEVICKPLNCMQKYLDVIRHHHEKINGTGYPDGLKGDEISKNARIVGAVDVFDALYSDRPYRKKLPLDKVKAIMLDEVQKGNLDKEIVSLIFEMADNNSFISELY